MRFSSNFCSSSGFDLVGLSSSLAILISNNFDSEDLGIIAAFVTTLGDNLALIATSRSACESSLETNESQKNSNEFSCTFDGSQKISNNSSCNFNS